MGELLIEIMYSEEGKEIPFVVFLETRGDNLAPHILPLHGLGIGPGIPIEESEVPIFAWASDTSASQVLLTLQVDPSWLLTG